MLSIFREETKSDGSPGPVSARRVTALACFFLFAPITAVLGFRFFNGWPSFIPCGLFIVAGLLLYFFTTWADIAAAAASFKK
ncbi:hypothetical protein AGMMS50268_41770 [Spirochaetia bacterium]|nr:hypothetical protein AGMMS50268_41770 [Spirochaetia bacterium]